MLEDDQGEYSEMKQLRMDCKYSPNKIQIESGNFWYEEEGTKEFLDKIFKSKAYSEAKNLKLNTIDFKLDDV